MIKDKAIELANAIMSTEEYAEYAKAKRKLEKDKVNQELLEEFRHKQWEIQLDMMMGEDVDESENEMMEEMYANISENSDINKFLLAEYRFTKVLSEIQDILLSSMDELKASKDLPPHLH